ncbi:lamin tail domain-containing protein [Porphyromonas sp.]|uniref:lamin tail domain-containing protein n=1 Tax=Porphyromonas sp. TaxID=1924944 RepID=UPI0026DC0E65|nr:lamin tail domain-containing protein [Porphyromonas sp.]MDO4771476.1 lamin tail domain-containing protein [Porphyromonas sp.]
MKFGTNAILVLLLLVLFSEVQGLAYAQTVAGWYGDVSSFVLHGDRLSIAEGAQGSSAMLYRGYEEQGEEAEYTIETYFDKPPTSRNTFKWEVISYRVGGEEYGLYVTPSPKGGEVSLYAELPSGTDRRLSQLSVPEPFGDWKRLKIYVDRKGREFRLRLVSPKKSVSGTWLTPPIEGETIRRMIFTAKFTKNEKKGLSWRLPRVGGPSTETETTDVTLLSVEPDASGRVVVTVDKEVVTTDAVAECDGFAPTIRSLPDDAKKFEINLHQAFAEGRVYTMRVKGLRTTEGVLVNDLSFEISTGGDGEEPPASDFGDWTGDLSLFVLKDGELSLRKDAPPGQATLALRYGDADRPRTFHMESRMQRPPTSRNTFYWQLFSFRAGNTTEALVVRPDNDAAAVQLYREATKGNKVTKRVLLGSVPVHSSKDSWKRLGITVLRNGDGLQIRTRESDGTEQGSALIPLSASEGFTGEMLFTAKFTKGEKDKLSWILPTVVEEEGDIPPAPPAPTPPVPEPPSEDKEVHISSVSATEDGIITVVFDREVDLSKAKATSRGFSPILTSDPDDPKRATIDMGKKLRTDHTYKLWLRGVRTRAGNEVKAIAFEVRVHKDAQPPVPPSPPDELTGWEGQVSHFEYRGGRLSINKGAVGPQSTISHTYGDEPTAWRYTLSCLFERIPSRYNTFRWELFSYTQEQQTLSYFVRPNSTGSTIQLCKEFTKGSSPAKISVLQEIALCDPSTAWSTLAITLNHTRKGLLMSVVEGESTHTAETLEVERLGVFSGKMKFTAVYTKDEKKKLHWRLPEVVQIEDDPDEGTPPVTPSPPDEIKGWDGQASHFEYREGRLSISKNAVGPQSAISHKYGDEPTAWQYDLTCLFDRVPSRYNTFRWELFSYTQEQQSVNYFVRPNSTGSTIQLCKELTKGSSPAKISVLQEIALRDPSSTWGNIAITITNTRKGLSLTIREGETSHVAEPIGIDRRGVFSGTMKFTAIYTKDEKKKLHWRLPEVKQIEDNPEVPTEPTPAPISGQLLFSEIMASPPEDGLLEGVRYIELYNPTDRTLPLEAFSLSYKNTAYTLPEAELLPKAYMTLFAADNQPAEPLEGMIAMEKFPALSGTFTLVLTNKTTEEESDRIKYSNALYGKGFDKGKASVERLSFTGKGDQWRRSDAPEGGTPSRPTKMKPSLSVSSASVVINEILLSPSGTGEKYIELHNPSDHDVRLQDLYLRYRNKPNADHTEWLIVTAPQTLPAKGYVVLTPYPDALVRLYPDVDPKTLIERIDFPGVSPTYTEIELVSHAEDEIIDSIIYRRQYLGDTSKDRIGSSLERRAPHLDGTKAETWRKALKESRGGTPGRVNSVHGLPPTDEEEESLEWPDSPRLDYEALQTFGERYADRLTLDVYTLKGQRVIVEQGKACLTFIENFRQGVLQWDTALYVISVRIKGEGDQQDLFYKSKWLYRSL